MSGKRRLMFVRGGIALVWLLLGTALFITGRGHALLVDNKDLNIPETAAPDLITVYVDGGRGVEYFRGDRDRVSVTGSKHRVKVEFSDGSPDFEGEFYLPIKDDMYLLSVTKMINGIEPFVEVFHTAPEPVDTSRLENSGDEAGGDIFGMSLDEPDQP